MNKLKLSRTSWLILSAGVFVVILTGLGLTRSQQLNEQKKIDETLNITTERLNKLEVTQLELENAELQRQLDESMLELSEVKDRLRNTVISADVTDEFFRIAEYSDVVVMDYRNTTKGKESLGSVECLMTSIQASIAGTASDLIDFIINLNNGYTTGVVKSINITFPQEAESDNATTSDNASTSISMTVYSYEGN